MMMNDFKDDFAILQIGLEDSIHAMLRLKVVIAPGGTNVTEAKVTIDILDDNDSALSLSEDMKSQGFIKKKNNLITNLTMGWGEQRFCLKKNLTW